MRSAAHQVYKERTTSRKRRHLRLLAFCLDGVGSPFGLVKLDGEALKSHVNLRTLPATKSFFTVVGPDRGFSFMHTTFWCPDLRARVPSPNDLERAGA